MRRHRSPQSGFVLASCCAVIAAAGVASAGSGPDVIVGELYDVTPAYGSGTQRAYSVGTISCNAGNVELDWIQETPAHPVIGLNMFRVAPVPGGGSRIEQLGQQWLKHGFTALQGTVCTSNRGTPGTSEYFPHAGCTPHVPSLTHPDQGDALGLGCSDPYTASLNDNQDPAGPKSEINAATGVFPFPRSWAAFPNIDADPQGDQPAWSGVLDRRIIVNVSDIDPTLNPTASYFVEGQYVTPDDAQAGNGWNNASYRRITFSNTYAMNLQDSTRRTRPAIFAWQEHGLGVNIPDPNVTLTPIDVPEIDAAGRFGNGRFWIGSRVTSLGGGQFRYEYAIQNLTSDRAGGSFVVPLPAGATVTNRGFRDVNYHSGEVWSNTDWTSSASASAVTWASPQTYAQNPKSNALRWATLYNFWFDCNVAPGAGAGKIGLFNPGVGAYAGLNEVGFRLDTPGGAAVTVAPHNDACANAMVVKAAEVGFSTVGAASSGPDECTDGFSSAAIDNDVWFRYTFTGSCTDTITFSTCGSGFDTKIAVYSGSACPSGPGSALACDDDTAGCDSNGSSVTVPTSTGATYLIRVGGYDGATGNGLLRIDAPLCGPVVGACCAANGDCNVVTQTLCGGGTYRGDNTTCSPNPCPAPLAPANNNCADAFWIADSAQGVTGTNANATNDGGAVCVSSNRDVWFKYRPATSGPVTLTTQNTAAGAGTNFDTVLSIHSACGAPVLPFPGGSDAVLGGGTNGAACDDDDGNTPGSSSLLANFPMTAGTTYFIRVAGFGGAGAQGTYRLTVTGGGGTVPAPPATDLCQNRAGVGDGALPFDTTNAATDGPATTGCGLSGSAQVDKDIWFNYPAQVTGTLTINLAGSTYDTRLAVYVGDTCTDLPSRLVACNDDADADNDGDVDPQSKLTVSIVRGTSYTIRIGGNAGAGGPGTLTLSSAASTGACCTGADCTVVNVPAECASGAFLGAGTTCDADPGNPTTCCRANFDGVGGVEVADIFAFLSAWFAQSPTANFDGTPAIEVADIFAFLSAWFAGC